MLSNSTIKIKKLKKALEFKNKYDESNWNSDIVSKCNKSKVLKRKVSPDLIVTYSVTGRNYHNYYVCGTIKAIWNRYGNDYGKKKIYLNILSPYIIGINGNILNTSSKYGEYYCLFKDGDDFYLNRSLDNLTKEEVEDIRRTLDEELEKDYNDGL